jgi:predicted HicB family RNase H-like nuclease
VTKGYEQRKAANERYLAKLDSILIRVPKGEKEDIQLYAQSIGESVNAFICRCIRQEMEKDTTAQK